MSLFQTMIADFPLGAALRPRASALAALLVLLGSAGPAAAQEHHGHDEIGTVHFDVSCDAAVRADFDRAVGMLHHMMYQQARAAFEEIAREDPDCGMAHWGIATTLFQPLWPARPSAADRQRGLEAVRKAKELGSLTPRERAVVEATEAFFRDPAEDVWWPRIQRWHEGLEAAHRQHPDDTETAAFYALSLLAAGQVAEDRVARNAKAGEVLAAIHARQPKHPGAIHYTIHANDISARAGESLEVVRAYDEVAPSVPHALHMPSHIYVRLGDWPDVIEWNRRSADAALNFPAGERLSLHYPHALDYLLYAHLQRGDDAKARKVLDELLTRDERFQEDFASAFHLAIMPARHAVERRAWSEAAALQPRTPDYLAWDRYLWPDAVTWFARGLGAVHTADLGEARAAERRLTELRDRARAADERQFASYIEIDRLILSGAIAQAEGDRSTAESLMREAARLEKTVEKHPITPGALLPPYEALGDLLMDQERPAEALRAYEESLEVWPNRYNSLLGAARAARAANEAERAREHYRKLLEVTREAETDRAGVREAREYVGR